VLSNGESGDISGRLNIGYKQDCYSVAESRGHRVYVDIDGDGLPDKVKRGTRSPCT